MTRNNFTPTFRKYADMNEGEKSAFRQGASMVDGNVQERLGLKKPREQKSAAATSPAPPAKTASPTKPTKATSPAKTTKTASPNDSFYGRYQQIKAKNKNALLFFRLGDFYEVLGEDAKTVSKALDLTLVARDTSSGRIPMCGVPHHALDRYVAKLVEKGYKVAVADETNRR